MKNNNQERRNSRQDNQSHSTAQAHEMRNHQGRFADNRDQNYQDSNAYNENQYSQENSYSGRNHKSSQQDQFGGNY